MHSECYICGTDLTRTRDSERVHVTTLTCPHQDKPYHRYGVPPVNARGTFADPGSVRIVLNSIRGDVGRLAGGRNKRNRKDFMTMITGLSYPIKDCGVGRLREILYLVLQPAGDCQAAKDRTLLEWAIKHA